MLFGLAPFFGSQAFGWMAERHELIGLVATLNGVSSRHVVFLLLAAPAGWVVAQRLRQLARAHERKGSSEVQLLARAWWLMLVSSLVISLVAGSPGTWGAPLCALAGLAFVPVQRLVLRRWPTARDAPPPRTLLFLRVFGFAARTERLFDRVGARWRALGPILMIAAPDVVARSLDPVDLLAWLEGREGDAFVRDADELQARLAAIDPARDPDGCFRINEFRCADSSWRATVVALMERADVVLMDLRHADGETRGCAFELAQLAARVPARKVVLVTDAQTQVEPLARHLGAAAASVVWHRMDRERSSAHDALFRKLVAAAA